MPAKRELSMRQLRHLLRLHHDGVSAREIGRRLGVARSTIQDNLKRAGAAGLAWPLADDITEEALETRLFGRAGVTQGQRRRTEPDWAALARELKRPGVTMSILWEEYREVHSEGYGYSRFCDLLRGFERRLTPVMRQHHVAGEKAFVDYSGKRIGIADPTTGEIREAEIFVGVLGASNLTYAEATWTQALPDWTGAHVRMFRFFGGAPKLLVPDNLKSGVNKASFYDPEINRTYGAMATHYSVGVLPARPKKPRDKAKVEAGVRFAQSYILGRLRHLTFFSLAECNAAITQVLLTTFSDTLADALLTKLRRLLAGEPRLAERIDVHSLTAIGLRLYKAHVGMANVAGNDVVRDLVREASAEIGGHKFSLHFLMTEWAQIVERVAAGGLGILSRRGAVREQDAHFRAAAKGVVVNPRQGSRRVESPQVDHGGAAFHGARDSDHQEQETRLRFRGRG